MASKSDFDSWLVSIGKRYLAEHPDEKLKITKTVTVPLNECSYCHKIGIGIPDWDFLDENKPTFSGLATEIRYIAGDATLVFTNSGSEYGYGYLKINNCPMCGRKINE